MEIRSAFLIHLRGEMNMRRSRCLFLACLFAAFALSAQTVPHAERFNPKPVSPRSIKVGTEPVHTLSAGGQAQCEVVIPEKACPVEKFAAAELSDYLGKIIGSKVSVTTRPSGEKTAFLLGAAGAPSAGVDLKTIDRDGYVIKSVGKNIVIAGIDDPKGNPAKEAGSYERGTLNGVYDFLERFGGVRFYFPGDIGTVVPSKPDWKIGSIDLLDRPDNLHRRTHCSRVRDLNNGKLEYYEGIAPADISRLSTLRLRHSSLNIPNCHGVRGLELPKRFAKSHPEYFALMEDGRRHDGSFSNWYEFGAGHLCYSNEGLKDVVYEDAKAFLTGQKASSRGISRWSPSLFSQPFFNIMPNDGLYVCRCENCRKLGAQLGGNPAVVWKFETDIARRLQQENIPGYITVMAYESYRKIPPVDIPSNVIVMLALTGPWKELSAARDADYQLLKDWNKKLNAKTYLWTYLTKILNLVADIPSFTPGAVASFYRQAAPYSFGSFMEAETDFWIFNCMNFYVFGKVMWDTSTDVDVLLDEHCRLMYGPAAAQMREFYSTLERHWLRIVSHIVETNVGPKAVLPSQYDLWTKIYSPAEVERINGLFDEAEKLTASDPDSLKRVKFMRKELWGPVLAGYERFNRFMADNSLWTIYMPEAAEKITVDGKLDESAWQQAKPVWMVPRGKEDAAEVHTRARMLCDAENIYIGIECDEPFTDQMVCAPREDQDIRMWLDNALELFFASKTSDDFRYQIMLNSDGKICDLRWPEGAKGSWRSGIEYKPGVVPGKMWCAEVRIPRSSMPELARDKFLVNFTRNRVLKQEKVKVPAYTWSRFTRHQTPEYFGNAIAGKEPESSNLLQGGDFDVREFTGRKGVFGVDSQPCWIAHRSDCPVTLDREVFRTGGQSIRLERPAGAVGSLCGILQYVPGLKAGKKYRLSFFVKLKNVHGDEQHPSAGFYAQIRFGTKDAGTVFRPLRQAFRGDIQWIRLGYTFTAPEGTGETGRPYLEFRLSEQAAGTVWIDQVELCEITEPEK